MSNSAVKSYDGTRCPRHHVKSTFTAEYLTPVIYLLNPVSC